MIELDRKTFGRRSVALASAAIQQIGSALPTDFIDFYLNYEGPFGGNRGYQLQDLIEGRDSIVESSAIAHAKLQLPESFLILTDLLGDAVLVLNMNDGAVYDVDMDDGLALLSIGGIEPRWRSFGEFLDEFFMGIDEQKKRTSSASGEAGAI